MGMKGVRAPFPWEKEKSLKMCPFCGSDLGKAGLAKLKAAGGCKCKKCGKIVLKPVH